MEPQAGQNLLFSGITFPQLEQNLVASHSETEGSAFGAVPSSFLWFDRPINNEGFFSIEVNATELGCNSIITYNIAATVT